jgi:hypothetical protein
MPRIAFARPRLVLHVQDGADMQAADAGMGIPGALGAVALEHGVQALGVVGEVFERTAQSSMKETGFPSPFIDIMMLRPASRTSAIAAWKPPSVTAHHLPGQAEIAHHLLQPVELLQQRPRPHARGTRR